MVAGMLMEPLIAWLCGKLSVDREAKTVHLLRVVRTFLLVNVGMLIFRAKDLKTAWEMLQSIFIPYQFKTDWFTWIWRRGNIRKYDLLIMIGSIVFLICYGKFKDRGGCLREELALKPLQLRWTVYITLVLLVIMFGAYGPGYGIQDFIYAHF